jgi:hypothetical protein
MILKNILIMPEIRKNFIFYILIIFSIATITSLSSTTDDLLNNNLIKNTLYQNILFFKSTLPILIFLFLILITFKKFKKNILINNSFIFILFFVLILLQIIGTIINSQNNIINLYYIIPIINIMIIYLKFSLISNNKFLRFYLNVNLIVFFLILLYFFCLYFKYYLEFDNDFYTVWGSIKNNEAVPRPTGLARLAMIFSAYFFCRYLFQKKNLFSLIFFNYLIFAFQSRVVILALLFISLLFILIKEKCSIIKAFKYLILIFIIPFVINTFINYSKRTILFNDHTFQVFKDDRIINSKMDLDKITSHRFNDWKNISIKFDKERVFGYGIHGDRILINQTSSNGFLYSLASGGYLAAIIYCIICIYSVFLLNLALVKKKFNQYSWFASSMIIFFLIRSLVENSFTILSFDFIIFFSSVFFLEKFFLKNQHLKQKSKKY